MEANSDHFYTTMIKPILVTLFGDIDKIGSQRYFVTLSCFIAALFLMFLGIIHFLMNLTFIHVFMAGIGSLFTMGLYFLVRFTRQLFLTKLILTSLGLIMLDWTWYAKYLSNGPVLYFILIFGALILWMWEGRLLAAFMGFYYLNFIVLFLIESNAHGAVLEYPENSLRSFDIYMSVVLYSVLLFFLLYSVKMDFKRKHEKAVKSDKLKSAFLANMSHEIRTPMNSIVGFSDLLTKETDPADYEHYISIIKDNSQNLLRLINDIIDLSKIEAGDLEIIQSDFDVGELLADCHAYYSIDLENRGKSNIEISYNLPEGGLLIRNDYMRLKQILSNLLSNAIKFTSQGSITFGCKKSGKDLIFSVSDTGTGIPEEDHDKIFNRFTTFNYQGMNTEGSGIGLSIVEKIVSFLEGSVRFTSINGVGTTFFVTVPYISPSKKNKTSHKSKNTMKLSFEKKSAKSILLVEDEKNSQDLLILMLKPLNMEIHNVTDGNEAIRHVIKNPDTSLVLMDLKLPFLDGYEATRMIKKVNPKIPIIAQTAYAMAGDREKALAAGCDDYITKPLSSSTLLPMIKAHLNN